MVKEFHLIINMESVSFAQFEQLNVGAATSHIKFLNSLEDMAGRKKYADIKAQIREKRDQNKVTRTKKAYISGSLEEVTFYDEFERLSRGYFKYFSPTFKTNKVPMGEFETYITGAASILKFKIRYLNTLALVLGFLCIKPDNGSFKLVTKFIENAPKLAKGDITSVDVLRYARFWQIHLPEIIKRGVEAEKEKAKSDEMEEEFYPVVEEEAEGVGEEEEVVDYD